MLTGARMNPDTQARMADFAIAGLSIDKQLTATDLPNPKRREPRKWEVVCTHPSHTRRPIDGTSQGERHGAAALIKESAMSVGKAAAMTAALVGAVAIGVAIGPTVRDTWSDDPAPPAATATAPKAEPEASGKAKTERRVRRTTPVRTLDVAAPKPKRADTIETVPVELWSHELRDRVKKVLNPGAKLELAAADFRNAEQFMTVAHAARNTKVPFVVLKHRVLTEGSSLADAIHEFKPELNAQAEVARARDAAREDLDIAG
jgi:preprotein translocase subunit SecD